MTDRIVERIYPGAFTKALENDDVRALFNHNSDMPLGRNKAGTLRLSVDDYGLRYEIDMQDTQVGRDVGFSVNRGDVTGSSFAFDVAEETWKRSEGMDIRELRELNLYDVGPVTYPAYEATTTSIRSVAERLEVWLCYERAEKWFSGKGQRERNRKMLTKGIRLNTV